MTINSTRVIPISNRDSIFITIRDSAGQCMDSICSGIFKLETTSVSGPIEHRTLKHTVQINPDVLPSLFHYFGILPTLHCESTWITDSTGQYSTTFRITNPACTVVGSDQYADAELVSTMEISFDCVEAYLPTFLVQTCLDLVWRLKEYSVAALDSKNTIC